MLSKIIMFSIMHTVQHSMHNSGFDSELGPE